MQYFIDRATGTAQWPTATTLGSLTRDAAAARPRTLLRTTALAVVFTALTGLSVSPPGAAAPTFLTYGVYGGWPNPGHINANANWSSDFGLDYAMGLVPEGTPNPDGSYDLVAQGNGSYTSSTPISGADTFMGMKDASLHYALDKRGGVAGVNTFSEGSISIPAAGVVDPSAVSMFHLSSRLDANEPGAGIGTDTTIQGSWFFDDVTGTTNEIFWAIEWVATVTGAAGTTFGKAEINGLNGVFPRRPVIGTLGGNNVDINSVLLDEGTYTITGSDYGSNGPGNWRSTLQLGTSVDDGAGAPGEAQIDLWVWIAFSTSEITDVVIPGAVPEPGSLLLFAVGIAGLAVRRRRATG